MASECTQNGKTKNIVLCFHFISDKKNTILKRQSTEVTLIKREKNMKNYDKIQQWQMTW